MNYRWEAASHGIQCLSETFSEDSKVNRHLPTSSQQPVYDEAFLVSCEADDPISRNCHEEHKNLEKSWSGIRPKIHFQSPRESGLRRSCTFCDDIHPELLFTAHAPTAVVTSKTPSQSWRRQPLGKVVSSFTHP